MAGVGRCTVSHYLQARRNAARARAHLLDSKLLAFKGEEIDARRQRVAPFSVPPSSPFGGKRTELRQLAQLQSTHLAQGSA